MANYTYETGSASTRFPNVIMSRHNFKDVTDTIATYLNKIKELQKKNNYSAAATYVETLAESGVDLTPYMLSAEYLNYLDEETRNVEIYAQTKQQQIFYSTSEPGESSIQDVWIN